MSHADPTPSAAEPLPAPPRPSPRGPGSAKIADRHLCLGAIVYIRQSSLQQVLHHPESTARQYELADWARTLGWPPERVLTIDDDQGQSGQQALPRAGFQRLLAEVSMGHVGLVLGLEMSRLARSSADFQHLLETCALRGTLIADQEGVYDPRDPNDRLLLGLKGTMSEFELVTMRNRLERGKLHKAERAALFHGAAIGYVLTAGGQLELDPDEEARAVVALVFAQFAERGSLAAVLRYLLEHGIRLGVRCRSGPGRGQLEWHRPNASTLARMLHNPVYAGAYAYGRSAEAGRPAARRRTRVVAMAAWKVLRRDCLPAYISWEQYQRNQERLRHNRVAPGAPGPTRQGAGLLAGLLVCGRCGHAMQVGYPRRGRPYYRCCWHRRRGEPGECVGLSAGAVDEAVAAALLRALEPASLELHRRALEDMQAERRRLDEHWQRRLERARYEAERVERQYQAVEPEDRLVARTLERRWEEALRQVQQVEEDYDRFGRQQPPGLTAWEREQVARLSEDVPALWHAAGTTAAERKEVVRCLVERVVVGVRPDSEVVEVTIHWHGGTCSRQAVSRPVRTLAQLRGGAALLERVRALRQAGRSAREIAATLNAEGFVPPQRRGPFTWDGVRQLLLRLGLSGGKKASHRLGRHEWWLHDLAVELGLAEETLGHWLRRGWVHGRRIPVQGYWVAWADGSELRRLRRLRACQRLGRHSIPSELKTPKKRGKA